MTTPPVQTINASDVGSIYHVGFGYSDPTPDQFGNTGVKSYGYMLVNGTQYTKKVNVQAQGQLIQASPNLTDRDLVVYPRINDGDFSGGGLQQIYIDPKKWYDSDLEFRIPGSLQLRPAWVRNTFTGTGRGGTPPQLQSVVFNGDVYTNFGETSGAFYNGAGVAQTGPGFQIFYMDSDGQYIYATDGNNNLSRWDGTSWTSLSTTLASATPVGIGAAHTQMWFINQGTAGHFLYFSISTGAGSSNVLARWDLGAAANTQGTQLPMGGDNITIVDLCPYAGAVALVTNDPQKGPGMNVWYHDGNNLQLMLRMGGYNGGGICNCLGNLFVTAHPVGGSTKAHRGSQLDSPILIQLSGGSFNIVAEVSIPGLTSSKAEAIQVGCPVSSGQYIAFPILNPTITGVSAVNYIAVYNVLTQAYGHLGNLDGNDLLNSASINPRGIAYNGRAIYMGFIIPTSTFAIQHQIIPALAGGLTFAATGSLVSSRIDFNTPGIGKMFRRVIVHHAPLPSGCTINLRAYTDTDPTTIVVGTGGQSVTNSTVGSTTTLLVLNQHTTGFSMVFTLTLTSTGASTPTIYYVTTEITVPWVWEMTVDCTSRRYVLGGEADPQGLRGQDLFFLLQNAWELAAPLTMYSAEGVTYTVEIQNFQSVSVSPQAGRIDPTKQQDFESHVTLTISESII